MTKPTVAILGASQNRRKFGNKSVRAHRDRGYDVYPINPNAEEIEGLPAYPTLADLPMEAVDRVSVYLSPAIGLALLDDISAIGPKEVWFNPGSDSEEILDRAQALGLNIITGCSIVDLGVSPADYRE